MGTSHRTPTEPDRVSTRLKPTANSRRGNANRIQFGAKDDLYGRVKDVRKVVRFHSRIFKDIELRILMRGGAGADLGSQSWSAAETAGGYVCCHIQHFSHPLRLRNFGGVPVFRCAPTLATFLKPLQGLYANAL